MASEFDDVLDQEAATAGQPLTSGLEKSEFADVLDAEVQQQQNYVRTIVDLATKDNPEAAAERARLSQATGLPPDVVARNQQELKRRELARAIDLQRMMRDSPVLFRQMTDPTFTGAAIDDLDTLKQIERTFGNVVDYAKSGEMASDAAGGARSLALGATVGVGKMVFDLFGAATDLVGLDYLAGGYRTMSKNAAESMGDFGMQVDTSTGQAIKSGLQSAGQNLALLPLGLERGLFKTAEAAGAAVAGAMSAGVGADAYMRAREQGADRLTSSLYGLSDAGVEFVMERIPASLLFKGIELDQSFLKILGQQTLSEGWTEQVTTIAQDFNEWMLLNPQKTTTEFLAERPEAAYQTLIATLVGTAVQTTAIAGINKLVERATDQSLTFEQDRLLRQMQLAGSSALRERSPEMFRAYVEQASATEDGPKEIYIDAEVLNQLPAEVLNQLPEAVRAQIPDALDTNSSVAIPMADVLTFAPGSVLEQTLNDNARMRPDAPSRVEAEQAKQFIEQEAERVLQQAQDQQAWQTEVDTVRDTIKAQLEQAGRFTSDANDAYARLQSAFFSTTASRMGMTPTQLYDQFSLKVGAQAGQGAVLNAQATLKQMSPGLFERLMSLVEQEAALSAYVDKLYAENDPAAEDEDARLAELRAAIDEIAPAAEEDLVEVDREPDSEDYAGVDDQLRNVYSEYKNGGLRGYSEETPEQNLAVAVRGILQSDGLRFRDTSKVSDAEALEIAKDAWDAYFERAARRALKKIKPSATGNRGTFDPADPNVLNQSVSTTTLQGDDVEPSDDVEAIVQSDIPDSVDAGATLENTLKVAKSKVWQKGRDLKLAIQEALQSLAQGAGVDVGSPSPQTTEYLVRVGLKDALFALEQNANAIGWYDLKTRQALAVMSLVHPEIATDENAQLAFVWALAVTSNGLKVGKNFEIAEQVYRQWKASAKKVEDRRMPTNVGIGTAKNAINKSLALFNTLRESWGNDDLRRFMLTNFTVGEITAINKSLKPGGEHADVTVRGAAILGPKIGNGFFSNLYGNFSALTMDRWLIRTWGRWTGTLIKPMPVQTGKARDRLSIVLQQIAADETERARLSDAIGTPITAEMSVDELAMAVQEASVDPAVREVLNRTDIGLELRKAGNSLAKYLDGQKEAPAGPSERKYIREVFGRILDDLRQDPRYADLTMADLQAVLWYAEKRLYESAKQDLADDDTIEGYSDDEAPDYANAAADVARKAGVTDRRINLALNKEANRGRATDARPGNGAEGSQPGSGQQGQTEGFTRQAKKFFIAARAILRVRSNRDGTGESPGTYTRAGDGGRGKARVLKALGVTYIDEWKISRSAGTIFKANQLASPPFIELAPGDVTNAQRFADAIIASKQASGAVGAAVFVYPAADYAGMRLFMSKDGTAGFALKPDGDIVSVFSQGGAGRAVMELAVSTGGKKLDAFDTILPEFYSAHGFVAVSRLTWDDSQAPDGWDKAALQRYNNGEPDVVFMVYDPTFTGGYLATDGRRYEGTTAYDDAVEAQGAAMRRVARAERGRARRNDQFYQNQQSPRGTFNPQTLLISLGESADLSTFLHESGHFFLEVMADLASRPDAPQQIVDDMNRALAWFGVPDLATWQGYTLDQKRPYHEKWAESFEQYLLEGKAPSTELQSLFRQFRAFLLRVYRSLFDFMAGRNLQVNDEIRQVFGRMLATDEEIRQAEEAAGLLPDFDGTNEAIERLQARKMRDLKWTLNARSKFLKQFTREAREARKAVLAEVIGEFETKPEVIAARAIRKVRNKEGPERQAKMEGIAAAAGYGSVSEMQTAVEAFGPVDAAIEGEVDRRMLERHADLATPEALEAAANAAVYNEAHIRSLATELKAQQDALSARTDTGNVSKTGRKITVNALVEASKQFALDLTARRRVRDLKRAAQQHRAATVRATQRWEAATRKGDTREAIQAQRDRLLNAQAAKSLTEAQGEVDRKVEYLRKFNKDTIRKKLPPEYLDQIDKLLERVDLRASVSGAQIDKRTSLAAWIASQNELGIDPIIPENLLEDIKLTSYKMMSVEELRGLHDTVKNIEHLGRLKSKLLKAKDKREFDAAAEAWAENIRANGGKAVVRLEPDGRAVRLFKGAWAEHRKLNSLVRQMDGGKDGAIGFRLLIASMNEQGTQEDVALEKAAEALGEIFAPIDALPGGLSGAQVFIPEINASLSRAARLAIALNWGNTQNRQRVMDGDGWTQAQVEAILATLSPAELEFVNKVWAHIDSYWPEIKAKQERVSGIVEEKVEAEPFSIKIADGTSVDMRGGYYPIKYDPDRSVRAQINDAKQAATDMLRGAMLRPTTRRGHTKARVDEVFGRPIRKDLSPITQHVTQVVHDLAWHEWAIDANRLLADKRIAAAIREHYGPETHRAMTDAVEAIVTGDVGKQTDVDKILLTLRANVTRSIMGVSATTALLQPFGLTQSMARIGVTPVLKGAWRWAGDAVKMESTLAWIHGKSDFMRLRAKTFNRDLREINQQIQGRWKVTQVMDAVLFAPMQKMQLIADVPTWVGAYEKALSEDVEESMAVAIADEAVLSSQGGGSIKDLSGVQRNHPFLTQFYSYFNATLQLVAEKTALTNWQNPRAVAGWVGDMALLAVIPAILPALITYALKGGGEDDEPEDWAKRLAGWQASYLLGMFVGLRELPAIWSPFDYQGPPAGKLINDGKRLVQQAGQGEIDDPAVLAAISLIGTTLGLPTTQIIRSYKGWREWDEGRAPASSILFGPPPKD